MGIVTADFSPDGGTLLTGSTDGYLVEWDGVTGARRRVLLDPSGQEDDSAPDVVFVEKGVETPAPFQLSRLSECMRRSSILSVRFSPDGSLFAVGAANGAIVLWRTETRGEMWYWSEHEERVEALAISRDNGFLAAGSGECGVDSLRVWRLKGLPLHDPSEAFTDEHHVGGVSCLCFSPDQRILAAGGFMMSGYTGPFLYEVETGKRVGSLLYDMTQSLDYSPDGRWIATGDDFGGVKIWDAASRTKLFEQQAHKRPVEVVAFSRDGARLASGSWDGTVKVWDVARRKKLAKYASGGIVVALRFDEDGSGIRVCAVEEKGPSMKVLRFP